MKFENMNSFHVLKSYLCLSLRFKNFGVLAVAQWIKNQTQCPWRVGSIAGLTQQVNDPALPQPVAIDVV